MRFLNLGLTLEEELCLRVVFGELLWLAAHLVDWAVVGLDRLRERGKSCGARLEGTSAAEGIGFIGNPAASDRLAMKTIALIVVHRHDGGIDGNLVEIRHRLSG